MLLAVACEFHPDKDKAGPELNVQQTWIKKGNPMDLIN
jgi:hypothetical protein